jgi:hypothetical protein
MFIHSLEEITAHFEMHAAQHERQLMEARERDPNVFTDNFNFATAMYTMCLEIKDLKEKVNLLREDVDV